MTLFPDILAINIANAIAACDMQQHAMGYNATLVHCVQAELPEQRLDFLFCLIVLDDVVAARMTTVEVRKYYEAKLCMILRGCFARQCAKSSAN